MIEILKIKEWKELFSEENQFSWIPDVEKSTVRRLKDNIIFRCTDEVFFFTEDGVEFCTIASFSLNDKDVYVISNENNMELKIQINFLQKPI